MVCGKLENLMRKWRCSEASKVIVVMTILEAGITVSNNEARKDITVVCSTWVSSPCQNAKAKQVITS